MSVSSAPLHIAIFVYDGAEVLDFSGPFEVFSTANRLATPAPFEVFLVGETGKLVSARGGFSVLPAIVTSAGISAGIEMSLHLVRQLYSVELAVKTARQMEFHWKP